MVTEKCNGEIFDAYARTLSDDLKKVGIFWFDPDYHARKPTKGEGHYIWEDKGLFYSADGYGGSDRGSILFNDFFAGDIDDFFRKQYDYFVNLILEERQPFLHGYKRSVAGMYLLSCMSEKYFFMDLEERKSNLSEGDFNRLMHHFHKYKQGEERKKRIKTTIYKIFQRNSHREDAL